MLFKISLRNIRRSMRDYTIYFFTLIIGVSIFYVFNAIGGQAAMLKFDESTNNIVEVLSAVLSVTSVFVAIVLAFLIVYASRFLMKRRNNEFAIYMMLGMSKGKISAILLTETIMIGVFSLGIGLVLGVGLSQLMSAVVANLFEADMTAYEFVVSQEAIIKTIIFFAVMYLAVMIFNSIAVTKMKLIDLVQSGRRSEKIRLHNPILSVIIFIISAAALGYAYYKVGWPDSTLSETTILIYISIGIVTTFLIFRSISGLLMRLVMSRKKTYYKGLNTFTFRQISSRINTMVFSMTVICLMLFITICTLTSSFSVRNAMNSNANLFCPADVEICFEYVEGGDRTLCAGIDEFAEKAGCDFKEPFEKYVQYKKYNDENFTFVSFLGDKYESVKKEFSHLVFSFKENIMSVSEYNAIMELYDREKLSIGSDEYAVVCDFSQMVEMRNRVLADKPDITVFGKTLHAGYDRCLDGFVNLTMEHTNIGLIIVPDDAVRTGGIDEECIVGKYGTSDKKETVKADKKIGKEVKKTLEFWSELLKQQNKDIDKEFDLSAVSRNEILMASVSLSAIITFLGLYIGLVFLIACGAILALKELSGSVDSVTRYEMLRKIGAEEKAITFSIFKQTGVFFLLPLLLAIVHSIFGMKFATYVLEAFGTKGIWGSITVTSCILLAIYGGYFLITFLSSKRIVREMSGKTE